jgi:hypothetical protein
VPESSTSIALWPSCLLVAAVFGVHLVWYGMCYAASAASDRRAVGRLTLSQRLRAPTHFAGEQRPCRRKSFVGTSR